MDVSSNTQLISSDGLENKKYDPVTKAEISMYKTFVEDIDRRYRVEFGTLEIKQKKIATIPWDFTLWWRESRRRTINGQAGAPGAAFDAVGKGKGKDDGRCNICNGEGHFARDCLSTPPLFPKPLSATDKTDEATTRASAQR